MMIRITSILLFCLSCLILSSCHTHAVTLVAPATTTTQHQPQPAVVTIQTKISSQNVPAFIITSVDHTTQAADKTGKQVYPDASSTWSTSGSGGQSSSGSPHFEDLLKSPQSSHGEEDDGTMTFRTAYKILSHDNTDDHPVPGDANGTSHPTTGASRESDSLQANPSHSVFSRYASRRRVPLFPGHRSRRYRRRRPSHYIPSDVYTIESSTRYAPRDLHSNAIHYQKALSYLRDYKKVLKDNRPHGISYRPNAYSDDPSHIRDAYGEMTPAVVQNYDTPQNPIDSPYNNQTTARSADQPSTYQSDAPSQNPSRQEPRQDPPLTNLPVTDIVPISNANKELVGYLPVIQIPRANDPQYRDLDLPQKDSPVQQQQQQNDDQQQKEERAPEARPQVPSTYLPLLPADIAADVKGLPQRDRQVPDAAADAGVKGKTRSRSGRKGRKRSGRRSKYLSPSVRSRQQRKRKGGKRRRNNRMRDEPSSSYLTSAASSSTRYHDRHYQTTGSSYQPRQSASSYPRYGIREQYDNVYPLFPSSSSPVMMRQSSSGSGREYPPARNLRQQQRLLPILNSSWRAGVH